MICMHFQGARRSDEHGGDTDTLIVGVETRGACWLHIQEVGDGGEMSEASETGEASGVSETIEARRCRSDAWCKGGRCTVE